MKGTVILGCGYTGARVARRLLAAGARVVATAREVEGLAPLAALGAEIVQVDALDPSTFPALRARAERLRGELSVLGSVPPVKRAGAIEDPTGTLLAQLGRPARVVYLSTTSVYGDQADVDARTGAAPRAPAHRARLAAEAVALSGPWSGMVLRPAAIYGPWRGIHATPAALRRAIDLDRVVSRIHVEDLARVCVAALSSSATGAWPVADDLPATPREVGAFCGSLGVGPAALGGDDRRDGRERDAGGRRVDGRAVLDLLGVELAYPSYRHGIPASLGEERRGLA